ncbi:leucine-rich repeat domain-containing protein [Leucobacter insecticola]|uniref:Leucine-rich repeat domain-containing protein n=1 Tax=Leucobacter insecticola TaxID=2714934 RepID=A0A6G8FHE6_9MICO|nr:leucine-rich repeat domain-containing protein [Leucobacter insecticola]QIM15785.1 leucine-rich repeat domain-containing protein [Leucobacter insecticola]
MDRSPPAESTPPAPPKPKPFAATEYVVAGTDLACSAAADPTGVVGVTDTAGLLDVTLDLTKIPAGFSAVSIPTEIAENCRNVIRQVTFVGSPAITELSIGADAFTQNLLGNELVSVIFPEGIERLDVGDRAFYQYAWDFDHTLSDIQFPTSLRDLTIGVGSFSQGRMNLSNGANALKKVTFPEGLVTLTIDEYAFYQIGGEQKSDSNELAEVSFPSTLRTLDIGYRAFSQWANGGGRNALTRVDFPEGLQVLKLADEAFYQSNFDENVLERVTFPGTLQTLSIGRAAFFARNHHVFLEFRTAEAPGMGPDSIFLDDWIAAPGGRSVLFWYGEPEQTSRVWADSLTSNAVDYTIMGYRRLDMRLFGGHITELNGSESRFAYPDGEGPTASFGGVPAYTGVSPVWPFGAYRLTLPQPEREGFTFQGWCEDEPVNGTCASVNGSIPAGSEYELTSPSTDPTVVYALWKAVPKPPVEPGPVEPNPVEPGPAEPSAPAEQLPETGTDSASLFAPFILCAAGIAMVMLGRRRVRR